MDSETLDMLRVSLRRVLTERSDRPLAERLDQLGWSDVVADDEATATRILFEIRGDTLASADALGPYLAGVLARALGDPSVAELGLVLPVGAIPAASIDAASTEGGVLIVDGVLLGAPPSSTELIIASSAGTIHAVRSDALSCAVAGGIDESMAMTRVTGRVVVSTERHLGGGAAWLTALAAGRAMLAAELVAIGHHVVSAAVEYTGSRVQHGKAIGTFQALQHRLASAHALVVGAGRLANEAVSTGDPWTALVAKSFAGRAAENACTQAQQCYGAIGFTWEHEFHRFLRRTYALDALLGDWRTLEHEIGATLQSAGQVRRIGTI